MIRAEVGTRIFEDMSEYFRDFDALLLPAAQVPPFDLSQEWISEITGIKLDTYIDWMSVCCMITVIYPYIRTGWLYGRRLASGDSAWGSRMVI